VSIITVALNVVAVLNATKAKAAQSQRINADLIMKGLSERQFEWLKR
jgi:hypothetical protein